MKKTIDNLKAFLFTLFVLIASSSFSQNPIEDISFVDQKVTENNIVYNSYRELANSLTSPWEKEEDKIRSIYFWIISNIDYQYSTKINLGQAILLGNPSAESEVTFKKRKGKCTGYASLFESMCNSVNLECYSIIGYAIDKVPCQIEEFTFYNHMWNGCRIDGRWYLMDLTWDSNTWKHTQSIDSLEFFVEPGRFINDHIPANPMWQLLDEPVSIQSLCNDSSITSHQSETFYSYNDSILKWSSLPTIDKKIYDRYQSYTFNPIICQFYGSALMEKGLDVAFGEYSNPENLYINMDKGRDFLIESLFYLKPYQVYENKDGNSFIRNDNVSILRKHVLKTIRFIEKAIVKMTMI